MAHVIEAAKSGRAACRTCKEPIAKGELRLGEEVPNQFAGGETTHVWHHLACAAKKRPGPSAPGRLTSARTRGQRIRGAGP